MIATMLSRRARRPRRFAPSISPCCRLFLDWMKKREWFTMLHSFHEKEHKVLFAQICMSCHYSSSLRKSSTWTLKRWIKIFWLGFTFQLREWNYNEFRHKTVCAIVNPATAIISDVEKCWASWSLCLLINRDPMPPLPISTSVHSGESPSRLH